MSQETSRSFRMDRPSNPPKLRRTSTMDKIKALVLQTYHKDSYMAHRRDWRQGLGHEGRYRRTQSPSPPAERRPSWPVSLSPPSVARSVSYAAPSRHSQPRSPLRLPQPASTGQLAAAGAPVGWQSSLPGSRCSAEPPSPSGGLTLSAVSHPSPSCRLRLPPPGTAAEEARPRHHSAGAVCGSRQLSSVSIEVVPPPLESEESDESESGELEPSAATKAVIPEAADEDDVFATVPPTAQPEEDPAESDTVEPPSRGVTDVSPPPPDNKTTPVAPSPPSPPPIPIPPPMPLSPPPLPSSLTPPTRPPSQRRSSAELLSVSQPSPDIIRRPSLPVAAADRSAGGVTAPLAVNGAHRASRVAAGLAWADRQGVRQTARDLLDPRRLPEITARQQQRWQRGVGDSEDSAADDSTADISWSAQLQLTSPTLTVTSHQVGVGRRIPLIVTTPVDPATDTAMSPSSESSASDSDGNTEALRQRQELSSRISHQLAVLREEQRAVEEEAAANAALGAAVAARVEQLARPSEAERYRAAVEQVTTITSLLLGLGGRLARTEAALAALPQHCPEEKALLTSKRDKLSSQLAEARQLEEGVRRRRHLVDTCLERYLSKDELADHRHFVQTKAKLIRDAREIDDKIRSGEEQLTAISRVALGR